MKQCTILYYRRQIFSRICTAGKIEQPGLPIAPAVLLQNVLLTEAIQAAPSAIGEEVKIGHNLSPDFLYFFRFMSCKDVIR